MKKNAYNRNTGKKYKLWKRITAMALCLCMIISIFFNIGGLVWQYGSSVGYAADSDSVMNKPVNARTRLADPSTMDTYESALNLDEDSRYAGRIWADKTVFAYDDTSRNKSREKSDRAWESEEKNTLTLDKSYDGVTKDISLNSDFLHVFSAMGSSQEYSGKIPTNVVIVIDNSGSMYGNSETWEKTRIAMTVSAVNTTIDKLMRGHTCNQVCVVMFGDGGNKDSSSSSTNTAVTIIPMGHYAYNTSGTEPYNYLDAGLALDGVTKAPSSPVHDTSGKKISSGWIYVNDRYINEKGVVDGSSDKYTRIYRNGTTNIQAGIYQGFQELINAPRKTTTFGDLTITHLPRLIVLTDGEMTDMLQGTYNSPAFNTAGSGAMLCNMGFINDFGNKCTSFIETFRDGYNNDNVTPKYTCTWDMLIRRNGNTNGSYQYEQIGYGNGERIPARVANNKKDPGVSGKEKLKEFADEYSSSKAYMLLSTLMTAAYGKSHTENVYNKKCKVYTITVDMPDPETINVQENDNSKPDSKIGNSDSYEITSNGPVMNPEEYFNKGWLKEKKYIPEETDINKVTQENTIYNSYTVGSSVICGIVSAVDAWESWKEDKTKVSFKGADSYVSIEEHKGLFAAIQDGKVDENDKGDGWTDFSKWKGSVTNYWEGKEHTNAYDVSSTVTNLEFPHLGNGDSNGVTDKDIENNLFYVSKEDAYYADTSRSAGDTATNAIDDIFASIVDSVNEDTFEPIAGQNDFNVKDSLTYVDPVGDYMDIKDVSYLTLFGTIYTVGVSAVYDYQFNINHMGYKEGTEGFSSGWYKVTTETNIDDAGNVTEKEKCEYSENVPEGCDDSQQAWEEGWTYYIDRNVALQYVPTLPDTSGEMNDKDREKIENTEYTFYRLTEYEDQFNYYNKEYDDKPAQGSITPGAGGGRKIPNVSYGFEKKKNSDGSYLDDYAHPKMTFNVSDIRIWIEDTGDWTDTTVGDSGAESSKEYNEALHVNIPNAALPIRTANIEIDDPFTLKSYTTNIKTKEDPIKGKGEVINNPYALPLRVYYSVGVADSIRAGDGQGINVAKISDEYVGSHKIVSGRNGSVSTEWRNKGYKDDDVDSIEFYSNWYTGQQYNSYVSIDGSRSYGDPIMTFSPSLNNRYYTFQTPAALYQLSAEEEAAFKAGNNPVEIDLGSSVIQYDKNGHIDTSKTEESAEYTEFITSHHVIESGKAQSDKWYYIISEYYKPNNDTSDTAHGGLLVRRAIPRIGSEFGSGISGDVDTGAYLTWFFTGDQKEDGTVLTIDERTSPYISSDTAGAEGKQYGLKDAENKIKKYDSYKWVLAARTGGLRSGDLSQNIRAKGAENDETITNGYYPSNKTYTANNSYLPTISISTKGSQDGRYDDDVIVNLYLGNNGRLTVSDTELLVTKRVQLPVANEVMENISKNQKYDYQVYISGFSGERSVTVVTYNETLGVWQRRLSSIDVITSNQDLMMDSSGNNLIMTNADGRIVVPSGTDGDGNVLYYYAKDDGTAGTEAYKGERYYIYIGKNSDSDGSEAADNSHTFRMYTSTIEDDGISGTVTERVENVVGAGDKLGEYDFNIISGVYLVPVEELNIDSATGLPYFNPNDSSFDAASYKCHYSDNKLVEYTSGGRKLNVLTMDATPEGSSEIIINSIYNTRSQYLTASLYFGQKVDENGNLIDGDPDQEGIQPVELTADDLFDKSDIPCNKYGNPHKADEVAKNTAQFTLRHGYGLSFSGVESGYCYRTTERLDNNELRAGSKLDCVVHDQESNEMTYKEVNDAAGRKEYGSSGSSLWEAWGSFDGAVHHDPVNNPSCSTGKADIDGRHYYYKDGEQLDSPYAGDGIEGGSILDATSKFGGDDSTGKTYSVFGDTSNETEEGVHYMNTYTPGILSFYKDLAAGENTPLTPEDWNNVFEFTITLTDSNGKPLVGDIYLTWTSNGVVLDDKDIGDYIQSKDTEHSAIANDYRIKKVTLTEADEGKLTFRMKAGQRVYLYGLPVNSKYSYEVNEKDNAEFELQDGSGSGTIEYDDTYHEHSIIVHNVRKNPEPVSVNLNAEKKVEPKDDYTIEDKEFIFTVTPHLTNPAKDPVSGTITAYNDADGNINLFDKLEYTKAGKYRYTVREVVNSRPGIEYDTKEYVIEVDVSEEKNKDDKPLHSVYTGKLKAAIYIISTDSEGKETKTEIKDGKLTGDKASFTNRYNEPEVLPVEAEITGVKDLVGAVPLNKDDFNFTLKAIDVKDLSGNIKTGVLPPMPEGSEPADSPQTKTVANDDDGLFRFGPVEFTGEGIYTYEVTETYDLPAVEGVEYSNVRYTVVYTVVKVTEKADDGTEKTHLVVSKSLKQAEAGSDKWKNWDAGIEFLNSTNQTPPDTVIEKEQAVTTGVSGEETTTDRTKDALTVKAGDIVTYYLTVHNKGGQTAYDRTVTDNIPEGLEYVPGSAKVEGYYNEDSSKIEDLPDEIEPEKVKVTYTDKDGKDVKGDKEGDGSKVAQIKWAPLIIPEDVYVTLVFQVKVPDGTVSGAWANTALLYEPENPYPEESNKVEVSTGGMHISKTVNGSADEKQETFIFRITVKEPDSLTGPAAVQPFPGTIMMYRTGSSNPSENGKGALSWNSYTQEGNTYYYAEFILKDNETVTLIGIPDGTYYKVEELTEDGAGISSGDVLEKGTNYTNGKYTVRIDGSDPEGIVDSDEKDFNVGFTNTSETDSKTGKLIISKDGDEYVDRDRAFSFTVHLYDADNQELTDAYSYKYGSSAGAGGTEGLPADGGAIRSGGSIALKAGQSITIEDLPAGTRYAVRENNTGYEYEKPDLALDSAPSEGQIDVNAADVIEVKYYNNGSEEHDPASGVLNITKEVEGDTEKAPANFEFTIKFFDRDDKPLSNVSYYITDKDGNMMPEEILKDGKVSLSAGSTITFIWLPMGAKFEIVESNTDKGACVVKGTVDNDVEGSREFTGNKITGQLKEEPGEAYVNVKYINTYYQNGSLSVAKEVLNHPEPAKEFGFTASFNGTKEDIDNLIEVSKSGNVKFKDEAGEEITEHTPPVWSDVSENPDGTYTVTCTFILKDGEKITINDIPVNVKYTVSETQRDGYNLQKIEPHTGDITVEDEIASGIITATVYTDADGNNIVTPETDMTFINSRAPVLPRAGSIGLWLFYIIGIALITVTVLCTFFYRRKKMIM